LHPLPKLPGQYFLPKGYGLPFDYSSRVTEIESILQVLIGIGYMSEINVLSSNYFILISPGYCPGDIINLFKLPNSSGTGQPRNPLSGR
jgi:hypothetical protein